MCAWVGARWRGRRPWVARAAPLGGESSQVIVDYDRKGRVLGIEFVGYVENRVSEISPIL